MDVTSHSKICNKSFNKKFTGHLSLET